LADFNAIIFLISVVGLQKKCIFAPAF